jgi:hypothetical protein
MSHEIDSARIYQWWKSKPRKSSELAFTSGVERQIAYWMEIAERDTERKMRGDATEESGAVNE